MWRITLLLNLLLMAVLGFASLVPMIHLENARQYGILTYPKAAMHPFTRVALQIPCLVWAIPLLWAILTIVLMTRKWQPDRARDVVALHTSATLLVGFTMLFFFLIAAILPFIKYYVRFP